MNDIISVLDSQVRTSLANIKSHYNLFVSIATGAKEEQESKLADHQNNWFYNRIFVKTEINSLIFHYDFGLVHLVFQSESRDGIFLERRLLDNSQK